MRSVLRTQYVGVENRVVETNGENQNKSNRSSSWRVARAQGFRKTDTQQISVIQGGSREKNAWRCMLSCMVNTAHLALTQVTRRLVGGLAQQRAKDGTAENFAEAPTRSAPGSRHRCHTRFVS